MEELIMYYERYVCASRHISGSEYTQMYLLCISAILRGIALNNTDSVYFKPYKIKDHSVGYRKVAATVIGVRYYITYLSVLFRTPRSDKEQAVVLVGEDNKKRSYECMKWLGYFKELTTLFHIAIRTLLASAAGK